MKIICAWCEREGQPSFLGERAPLLDERLTHGICRQHLDTYLRSCGSTSRTSRLEDEDEFLPTSRVSRRPQYAKTS